MRLINADKLMEYANNTKDKSIDANDIARFPTIDPVKHGYWIKKEPTYRTEIFVCSECFETGKYHVWSYMDGLNYCPHCGAKMDEVSE